MPTLNATSMKEITVLIEKYRKEIEQGEYDIAIEAEVANKLGDETAMFLIQYCPSSWQAIATANALGKDVYTSLAAKANQDEIIEAIINNLNMPGDAISIVITTLLNALTTTKREWSNTDDNASTFKEHYVSVFKLKNIYEKIIKISKHKNIPITALMQLINIYSDYTSNINDAGMGIIKNNKMKDFETDKYEDASGERGMQILCGMHLAVSLHNLEEKLRVMAVGHVMSWPDHDQMNEMIPDLAKHPLPMVRAAVAAHSDIPQDFIELLAMDSDPVVRAAILRNPSAPESVCEKLSHDQEVVSLRTKNNKKSGCFIATAVYGDPFAPELILLRHFRDQWLLRRRWGKVFVDVYYAVSPSIARFIGQHECTKLSIRWLFLDPVVKIIRQKFSD